MGQSYRIRTEVGIDKTIDVLLEQDFEFLEILSLKIQQEDIYNRNCADYGVIVGRVTANNGFGLPNARVSIFIPISDIDQSNPIISSIYPYKSPSDKNSDGYRYNLLPYEASYSGHSATGTLPTRLDVLTGTTAVEIYDKYYKFTCKTNDSGDYMIMGVPTGQQTLVMDVDLSDIGEFSLTPQDLIRMGLASQAQVAGNRFRTSTDLNSLPQIVNSVKNLEVSPLWGDPTTCQIAINRVDFDLRDNANIDIQPTAVFMGSIFSTTDDYRLRKNCKPRDDMGNLCSLITSPGQIIAIRQTIDQDDEGNPVLETYQLEQSGNVIDGDGTWVTELPMNLDYFTTNEFGERVVSYDPTIGIPTKAKYRFKVKWTQPPDLSQSVRRPYYLLPNVKEAGWDANGTVDPYLFPTVETQKKLASSYYFGLAWSGYTDGYSGLQKTQRLNEVINCEDTFYEFGFNRVYSPSLLIDEFKKGSRGQFIGIKEIDDSSCNSSINKFPVNEGVRNFDLIYFLFSILMQIFQVVGLVLLYVAHILIFLYSIVIDVICWIKKTFNPGFLKSFNCTKRDFTFKLPMITYPDCQACDCTSDLNSIPYQPPADVIGTGALSYLSQPALYRPTLLGGVYSADTTNGDEYAVMTAEALAGFAGLAFQSDFQRYKLPISSPVLVDKGSGVFWWRLQSSKNLPLGERINLFNQRSNFFTGQNKIKVTFAKNQNIGKFHYDNTLTVLLRNGAELNPGDLISFVSLESSTDLNYTYTALTSTGITKGISGQTLHTLSSTPSVNVKYATAQYSSLNVSYTLPYGTDNDKYKFPSDIEYYQVVTAITISNAISVWNTGTTQSFPNLINTPSAVNMFEYQYGSNEGWYLFADSSKLVINPLEQFENYGDQTILILQRGVDPYSPKYVNEYDTSILFGQPLGTPGFVFTAETRLNVPIQPLPSTTTISVQSLSNQADFSFNSYFFSPGIPGSTTPGLQYSAYSTTNLAYYGNLDSSQSPSIYWNISGNKVVSKTSNGFYLSTPNASKYDNSEDVSGMGIMSIFDYSAKTTDSRFTTGLNNMPSALKGYYTSSSYFPLPLNMGNNFSVVRTDRLPTSDKLDGLGATLGPGLNNVMLQQNLNFAIYVVSEEGVTVNGISNTTGADIVTPDLEGLPNDIRVLESFNCESMVGLGCYQGFGDNFSINQNCTQEDPVENGCYVMLKRPIVDLRKDVKTFAEWGYRFRFFYGLCRGVLSQTFTNNWINGGLYMFPIQVDTFYDKKNKPEYPIFCYDTVYFDINTNNFYYRSSPYNVPNKKFVGNRRTGVEYVPTASNDRNLMYPTTIINLGFKDSIYSNLTFNPETNSYIIPQLNPTSYADVSDLINLFVISRITDESFLQQIVSGANDSIGQLFSRPLNSIRQRKRVDGDLVQLLSINSEIGNINFSPQFYETPPNGGPPTTILGTAGDPTIAVWFSSTTQDLQTKDYLTPGRINFRSADNTYYYPYPYGIKTQVVPFYQWRLSNTDTIFGNQYNNWATKDYDIVQGKGYQSLDRTNLTTPNYFRPSTSSVNDLYARGYIFSVDANGNYSQTGATSDTFIVGAPFQFYFGINKGQSALDKFKTKYSVVE
jgi:hypothetical protein